MNKHLFGLRWFPSGQSRAAQKLGLDPERGWGGGDPGVTLNPAEAPWSR